MRISDCSSDVCSYDVSCGRIRLTLRELRGAACLVQPDLLALDLACVAGHEARRAQLALERLVVLDQRAGDAQAERTGLAGGSHAAGGDEDVDALGVLGQPERPAQDNARVIPAAAPWNGTPAYRGRGV